VIVDESTVVLLVLKATAMLLAGAAVARSLRRADAGARHLVWLATLLGVLALPAALRFAPLHLEVLPRALGGVEEASPRDESQTRPIIRATGSPGISLTTPREAASRPAEPTPWAEHVAWPQVLLAAWGAGALVLMGYLCAAVWAVRRIIQAASPLDDPQWTALLAEAADRLDLGVLPRLVASDRVEVPFAFGAWRPTIVFPSRAAEWSDERRRLVLSHELSHVKRHDLVGHTLARIGCALYWFHPLVWVAARRLRAESERACDDLVLRSGARASDYAEHLLDILSSVRGQDVPAAALAMARKREFEGRLLAILDPGLKRGTRRAPMVALLAGLCALFVTVAAASPPSAPRASTSPARATAPRAVVATSLVPAAAVAVAPHPASPKATAQEPADAVAPEDPAEPDEDDRKGAVQEISADRRATLVRVLATDADESVRRTAAWALADSRDGTSALALGTALRVDASADVREMAAWALSDVRGEAATAALAESLRRDASEEVRATAAWALGQRRLDDASVLVAAVSDAAAEVREVAIWALGNQGMDKAPEALVAALGDPDGEVRVVAAWALAHIHDQASSSALQIAFKAEKDDEVRQALFHALFLIGERSPEVTEWAFGTKDPEIRRVAEKKHAIRGFCPWPWQRPRPAPRPFH
jgi:beta-lactamase regulating signal transducer with metallopeptidase domain